MSPASALAGCPSSARDRSGYAQERRCNARCPRPVMKPMRHRLRTLPCAPARIAAARAARRARLQRLRARDDQPRRLARRPAPRDGQGPRRAHNTLTGRHGVHNYLLGGYGNDTIYGGNAGDVIWGDYHPTGWPSSRPPSSTPATAPTSSTPTTPSTTCGPAPTPRPSSTRTRTAGIIHCENPRHRRLHQPPRAAPLEARGLPPHQLLLRRLLSLGADGAGDAFGGLLQRGPAGLLDP